MRKTDFSRVTRKSVCPVCGKPDWCSTFAEGQMAICMRVAAGSIKQTHNGGYLHKLREYDSGLHYRPSDNYRPLPNKEHTIAAVDVRHAVYTALLESSTLATRHADSLVARGISEDSITRNLYASAPLPTGIIADLASRFNLSGVPGFYREHGEWQFVSTQWQGFFIPIRDAQERIQALQFRHDDGTPRSRYCWVSSPNRPAGATSGTPIHFSAPHQLSLKPSLRVWITEGALKADAISDQLQNTVIAVAGVNAFSDTLADDLKKSLPTLTAIAVAFDADSDRNPAVAQALERLARLLCAGGLRVQIARWKEAYGKGLDDVLAHNGGQHEQR